MIFGMFTGCSGFVVEDESLIITSITSQVLDDGRTMVVITYADEEIAPAIFYLPKGDTGEQGEEGNGIKEITHELDERTNNLQKNRQRGQKRQRCQLLCFLFCGCDHIFSFLLRGKSKQFERSSSYSL